MTGTKDIHSLLTINIRLCLPLSSTGGMDELLFMLGLWPDCAGLFAGEPAPTDAEQDSSHAQYLWERVYPRRGTDRQQRIQGCIWSSSFMVKASVLPICTARSRHS